MRDFILQWILCVSIVFIIFEEWEISNINDNIKEDHPVAQPSTQACATGSAYTITQGKKTHNNLFYVSLGMWPCQNVTVSSFLFTKVVWPTVVYTLA